nr:hypothetical protein [Clostridiales bacterium]
MNDFLEKSYIDGWLPEGYDPDAPIREPIIKLSKMITSRALQHLGVKKLTTRDPEYWALATILTDEEANLCLSFGGIRKPKTYEQIKQASGLDDAKLTDLLEHLSWMGILEYNWENLDGKNPKGEKRWLVPMFVPGSAE